MKIGFLQHGRENSAGTRVRVLYVTKYMENAVTSQAIQDLRDCNAVIFQKRYKVEDVAFAKELKAQRKKVLVDLCDPVWDKDHPGVYFPITGDRQEDFEELLRISDMVMLCTSRLQEMFYEKYAHIKNMVFIDRFDLELHKISKVHQQHESFTILWHGTKFNVPSIEIAREELEKLYKEIDFKLVIIHEKGAEQLKSFNFKTKYKIWDLNTINEEITKADITLNTHEFQSYKSNGKTVKSWALGVPCVETNYYANCKKLLQSAELRNTLSINNRKLVEDIYDSKISAQQLEELICNL